MIQEQYITFEVAKLLKEKGFIQQTSSAYYINGDIEYIKELNKYRYWWQADHWFPRFTQQMAMRWLREVHNIFIDIVHLDKDKYTYYLYRYYSTQPERYVQHSNPNYTNYEQACESAIRYCLEKLI